MVNANKPWNECSTTQKRHRIFHIIQNKTIYFWKVCGKDRQEYYNHVEINDDNVDAIRDKLYDEYVLALESGNYFDVDIKIDKISRFLGKGKYENLYTLEKESR